MREDVRALHKMARVLQTAHETQMGFAAHLRVMAERRDARAEEIWRQIVEIRERLQEIGDMPS
jgi:hypothetical protein